MSYEEINIMYSPNVSNGILAGVLLFGMLDVNSWFILANTRILKLFIRSYISRQMLDPVIEQFV